MCVCVRDFFLCFVLLFCRYALFLFARAPFFFISHFFFVRAPTTAARAQTDSAAHVTKLDALNGYLHHHAVPRHLQQRVLSYMGYVWASHRGGTLADEVEALATLPVTIQLDLAVATKLPLIERCPFFDFCSRDVHRALAAALATLRFATGDIIVQHGDLGAEMYFLVSGHVEVRVRCGGRGVQR